MADMERLFRIQSCLDQVDDAIAATSLQAKPAIAGLLREAYFEAQAIMRKGALRALKLGKAGAFQRKHLRAELVQRLIELAEIPPSGAADAAQGGTEGTAQGAGDLDSEPEPAAAGDCSSDPV
jgi:hypothetical protein